MAEDINRPGRTTPETPDQSAPVLTEQTERHHDEVRDQRRQNVVMPSSDGTSEELLKTTPASS